MKKIKVVPIALIIIVLLLVAGIASGLRVDGAILEKEVSRGEHLSHIMLVSTSASDAPTDIQIDVSGYGQSLSGINTVLNSTEDTSPYSVRTSLKVSSDKFHLAPGENKEVTLEGDIPVESSGGKYALIYVHTAPQGNGTVGVATAIIVPVRLTINGSEIRHTGEIQNFTLIDPVSAKEQNISFIFKNTGNHHYRIQSDVVVTDKDGNIVANATKPNPGAPIIPEATRLIKFNIKPQSPLKPGDYSANVTVKEENGSLLATKETKFKLS